MDWFFGEEVVGYKKYWSRTRRRHDTVHYKIGIFRYWDESKCYHGPLKILKNEKFRGSMPQVNKTVYEGSH